VRILKAREDLRVAIDALFELNWQFAWKTALTELFEPLEVFNMTVIG
jgi:hypothetical protein